MIDNKLLEILACPLCQDDLNICLEKKDKIICYKCNSLFSIKDNIPILLEEKVLSKA